MEEKLSQIAAKNLENARTEKKDSQTVRLWLNQISPDNYERKKTELRGLLFGDRKCKDEPGFVQDDSYEPDQEK